jgi:hypothetical protein
LAIIKDLWNEDYSFPEYKETEDCHEDMSDECFGNIVSKLDPGRETEKL